MSHHAKRVLIVEDDADARESLAALVETEGYATLQAEHGADALRMLRESDVCVVLLDIFMPVMNGWSFLDERAADAALAAIPVVVITADPAAARQAATRGIAGTLAKPLEHADLFELLARHC